jgi:hypothetical protein
MNNCGYRRLWTDTKGKPWTTTLKSKLEMLDCLRECLPIITILPQCTWMELRGLTIAPGKVAPEAPKGSHDDAAISIALAYRALRDVPKQRREMTQTTTARIKDLIDASRARRTRSRNLPF